MIATVKQESKTFQLYKEVQVIIPFGRKYVERMSLVTECQKVSSFGNSV